jgi:hypothetical protein
METMNGNALAKAVLRTLHVGALAEGQEPGTKSRFMLHAVVLAGELNVAKAAHRLRIQPSQLKRCILNLEQSIGATLFLFSETDATGLTPAGRRYIPEARKALYHVARSLAVLPGPKADEMRLFLEELLIPSERVH